MFKTQWRQHELARPEKGKGFWEGRAVGSKLSLAGRTSRCQAQAGLQWLHPLRTADVDLEQASSR